MEKITQEDARLKAGEILRAMTPAERFDFVCGSGMGIRAVPRLEVPPVHFADASGGLRRGDPLTRQMEKTTAFPSPILLAATWDPMAAHEHARMIGEECRAAGIHFLLGPGMNMHRNTLCGRNFEYFGEDPFLVSSMVEGFVRGLQGTGTHATLKHFIGNETDHKRCSSNTLMDEAALREIYLPPFLAGIAAGARAVMTAYNQFDGEWCGESARLNRDLLRGEFGFEGIIMTDWSSVFNGEKVIASGVDLEMPDGMSLRVMRESLEGSPKIDQMVLRILETCIRAGCYEDTPRKPATESMFRDHSRGAREINEKAIVLLKNNSILPLNPAKIDGTIIVTGNAATRIPLAGGGSARVEGFDNKSYLQALEEAWGVKKVVHSTEPDDDTLQNAGCVLVFSGFDPDKCPEGEGFDHPFALPDDPLIRRCAAMNPRTVIGVVTGCGVAMEWHEDAAAVLWLGLGGQTAATACVNILNGTVNPSGKLPFTIERRFEDSPAWKYDEAPPDRSHPHHIGHAMPKGMWPQFFSNEEHTEFYTYDVHYHEGILVGYRWYDKKEIPVRYPFGHGLSYARVRYSRLSLEVENESILVRCMLHNEGPRGGDEVVQVYVGTTPATAGRPPRELKAFLRQPLRKGERKQIECRIPINSLKVWNTSHRRWELPRGNYTFWVGASSRDLRLSASLNL